MLASCLAFLISESLIYFVSLIHFGGYCFLAGVVASRRGTECEGLELSLGMADTAAIRREGAQRCLGSLSFLCPVV